MYSPTCSRDYNPFYNLLLRLQSFLQLVPLICAPGIVCFVSLAHRLVIPLALFLFPTPLWYTTTHIVVSLWIIAGSPFFCSSGTVRRKLVNKGIHLVCVFSTHINSYGANGPVEDRQIVRYCTGPRAVATNREKTLAMLRAYSTNKRL